MQLAQNPPPLIGVDQTASSLRCATLQRRKKGWEILRLEELQHPPSPGNAIVVSALHGREVLVRSLDLPVKKEKEIEAALVFQLEPLLPYPVSRSVCEKVILERHALGTSMTLCAVRSDHLTQHIQSTPLEPEIVTCVPLALAAITPLLTQTTDPLLVIHVGMYEATCALVQKGNLLAAYATEVDRHAIQKAVLSLSQSPKGKGAAATLLLGDAHKFEEAIAQIAEKPLLEPSLTFVGSKENLQTFGLAIGVALAFERNFRKGAHAYPHPWKRLKRPLLLGLAAIFLLTASTFGITHSLLASKRKTVIGSYQTLLSLSGKKEAPPRTLAALAASLEEMQKELSSKPEAYPLLPLVPKVSDVLSWLSAHPQVAEVDSGISFDSVQYAMVRKPDLSHKREKYLVRVDLEFTAKNPSAARAFHDALLAPNPFVDPGQEVQWHAGKGSWRASFYLKDKTRYSA